MELTDLRLDNLRIFAEQTIELEPGWNLFVGGNGAGKTTILEAVYLLSHGRSFRNHARETLLREHARTLSVSALVTHGGRGTGGSRVGIGFTNRVLEARVNGSRVAAAELMSQVAVSCFEPGSHSIIVGAAEERRRFIDWGMFHVEPRFLEAWRRYNRALKQRNAALRLSCSDAELDVWDEELATAAAPLIEMRTRYADVFNRAVAEELALMLGELGWARFDLANGTRPGFELTKALTDRRQRDRATGYTGVGPHRADWAISFERARTHHHLSRGQAKLAAFACVMAQVRIHCTERGENPIICLDDPASELDSVHVQRVMERMCSLDAQILITGSDENRAVSTGSDHPAMFHVEHGSVRKML